MIVRLMVTMDAKPECEDKPTATQIRESVAEAVRNAMRDAEDDGYDHPLSDDLYCSFRAVSQMEFGNPTEETP